MTTVPPGAESGGVPRRALFRTTATIEEEFRRLLCSRCRLLFGLALAITVVMIAAAQLVTEQGNAFLASLGLGGYEWAFDGMHVVSFALAFASLFIGDPSARRLQDTVLVTVSFNFVVGLFSMGGTLDPDYPPALGASLMLFVPAAVIPWKTKYQAWLGFLTVVAFVLVHTLGYSLSPVGAEYWAEAGGMEAFREDLLITTIGLIILAGTSVLVTSRLYSLRTTAQKAKRLGSYELKDELGEGGMGTVYLAQHALMVRPAAIKVLRVGEQDGLSAMMRFEREVQLSSNLTHPNTITIFDYGRSADDTFYYAMEYLDGLDLQELVDRYGPMPANRVAYLLAQVCGSLSEAHSLGIVHRDLKPSNIFLTSRGGICDFVKVLDFGIAKQLHVKETGQVTRTGMVVGTPSYLAPESVLEGEEIDGRLDIYCLGGIAYWLLTGHPPFTDTSPLAIIASHLHTQPEPPSDFAEDPVPEQLDRIVLRCLEKQPADRFQTARDLLEALESVPFEMRWTAQKAKEWWDLHHPCESPVASISPLAAPTEAQAPASA
jgi:serine/threonine-protein kinase